MTHAFRNTILQGDCLDILPTIADNSVAFVLTDPPYVVSYRSRDGRKVANDDNGRWLKPAFRELYRVLKPGSFCVSFYGWAKVDHFMSAWREAGFRPVGHLAFRKRYASASRYLRYQHEVAYLLAKGNTTMPATTIPDVLDFPYTGNKLHPTEKPVAALTPLIEAFCPTDGIVLDPFCGSGSTLAAARQIGRGYCGIELSQEHHRTAVARLADRPPLAA